QIDRGLEPRRPCDLVFEYREHGIATVRRRGRYEQHIGLRNRASELARRRRPIEHQHLGWPIAEALSPERSRALRAARGSDDAIEALAEFADVMPGAVAQPETNEGRHQGAVAASAAAHAPAPGGSPRCAGGSPEGGASRSAGKRRLTAHTAAPRTSAEGSPNSRMASGASVASPELPIAMSTLRTKRLRPVRLIGDFENIFRNAASSRRERSARRGACNSRRADSFSAWPACANLFHGHTARQSSQPKMRLPIAARSSRGIGPLCSIVR